MKQYGLLNRLFDFFNLDNDLDRMEKIHETICKEIIFKGTNLWILIFAIIVASVGLNMNSTAVIIGAMLISPLMGPINGMGYSLATYNFALFRKAAKNFGFAVVASLLASSLYFTVSPISTAHSELLARTSPTIYDVLIALFGGLAGIVAISSKHKGNVIPGVAIATALMPPLCTAGYGLATWQLNYFFGAFYLFTINTVFIAISSVLISKILKFPDSNIINNNQKKRVHRWVSIIMALVMLPSVYLGYDLVKKEKFIKNATDYINSISVFEGRYLLKNEIRPQRNTIVLFYSGATLSENQKKSIREKANLFSLNNEIKIEFPQGTSGDEIFRQNPDANNLKAEINRLNLLLKMKDYQADSLENINKMGREILSEIKTLYPQVTKCTYSVSNTFSNSENGPNKTGIVVLAVKNNSLKNSDKIKIENWLRERLKSDKLKVLYE